LIKLKEYFLTSGAEPQIRRQVIHKLSKYVGLDVHKATIAVSVTDGSSSEVRYVGEIVNTPEDINKLVKQLKVGDASLCFCYEAGPCGYGIHLQLTDLGWDCIVVAPSLIPKKSRRPR
jgi:transposase